jgi:uncharacterized membrane protein YeaQ/YmgE (transglycosylase-associated protein family)
MVNFVVWVVVGGALGLAVSGLVRHDSTPGRLLNVIAGVVGAALAALLITPLFTAQWVPPTSFSGLALLAALGGAGLLLMLVNLPRPVR